MRHTILGTFVSILVVSVITMFAAIYASDVRAEKAEALNNNNERLQVQEEDAIKEVEEAKDIYVLKESNGKLAIFLNDNEEPMEVLNVYIKTLPAYDQDQLHQGIKVESGAELASLIEDYSS